MKVFAITLFSGLFIIWCCSTFLPFQCLKFRAENPIKHFDSTGNLSDLKVRDSTGKLVAIKDIDSTGKLIDEKPTADDEWQQGDFVTYRRIYPHQRCGGQMVFNGKSERAPYSETDRFYDHVCDKCSTTNQILNATWPQYKREWRAQ
jgi:hypothetical protein